MKKIFTLFAGFVLASTLDANADAVWLYPDDYEGNPLADYFKTEISKDAEGNFVISDFLYSEAPVSFTFEKPEPAKSSNMIFTGALDRTYEYPYLLDAEGENMTCWLWKYNGLEDWTPIYNPYVFEDGYSYVYRYDLTDPENEGFEYEYYGCICMAGVNEDNTFFGYVYVDFWFNEPETDAVNAIEASDSNKVEFFNLNGQRIENPANGLFIRKQGNKTSKVMIR